MCSTWRKWSSSMRIRFSMNSWKILWKWLLWMTGGLCVPSRLGGAEAGWGAGVQIPQHHPHHGGCQQSGRTPGLAAQRPRPGHQVSLLLNFLLLENINRANVLAQTPPSSHQHAATLISPLGGQTLYQQEGEPSHCQLPESRHEGAAEQVTT